MSESWPGDRLPLPFPTTSTPRPFYYIYYFINIGNDKTLLP